MADKAPSVSKQFAEIANHAEATALLPAVITLSSLAVDAAPLSQGLQSKLLLDKSFHDGLVLPAQQFVLCFKHGLTSISEISALSFHFIKGNNTGSSGGESLGAHRSLLQKQLELEIESYNKYKDVMRSANTAVHNANAILQASEDVHIRELARLYERSSQIGKILQDRFVSQFRLKTLCATILTLGLGTNQALYRPMRNAIQHFHVDREGDSITFFNRRDDSSDIEFVFCWKEEEFKRHAKFALTVMNELVIRILSEIIEAIDHELKDAAEQNREVQGKFTINIKWAKNK